MYSSDEYGGRKVQGGVRRAVKNSITRAARPREFTSDRVLKATLELRGRAKSVTYIVTHSLTKTQIASKKDTFWTTLDRIVEDARKHEWLFVLMDAKTRTRMREARGGVYGRDTPNDNGDVLLSFTSNHDLALVNTFSSTLRAACNILSTGEAKNVSITS